MTKTEVFDTFSNNVKVDNPDVFCGRYKEGNNKIPMALNDEIQFGYLGLDITPFEKSVAPFLLSFIAETPRRQGFRL